MKSPFQILCLALAFSGVLTSALAQTAVSPAATPTAAVTSVAPEGFVMISGKVHVVRQGQAIPLDRELTLRVSPTGITGFDQMPRTLTNNNMLTMDGRVVAAPPGLVVAPPPPKVSAEAARNLDSGVIGENLSGLAPAQVSQPPASAPSRPVLRTTTVTAPTVAVPQPAAVAAPTPAPRPAVTTNPIPAVPATTVFDPNVVNDGSIEAAGTGTRRPQQ